MQSARLFSSALSSYLPSSPDLTQWKETQSCALSKCNTRLLTIKCFQKHRIEHKWYGENGWHYIQQEQISISVSLISRWLNYVAEENGVNRAG